MDRLKKLFDGGEMILSAWSGMQDPMYLAALARTGIDAVTLDMQHGMQTETSLIAGITALAPTGKPCLVRIPVGRFDLVSRALDAGAHGIIAPMINSVEDAEQLVSFAKYIPVGDRSFGAAYAASIMGVPPVEYVKAANTNTTIFAFITWRWSRRLERIPTSSKRGTASEPSWWGNVEPEIGVPHSVQW